MVWSPELYLRFGGLRLRPALELLERCGLERAPRSIIDLGAGTGNITPFLRARWPEAAITCVDASAEMLAQARASHAEAGIAGVEYVQARFEEFAPPAGGPADLVFSNAALHWAPEHERLLPHLLETLVAPGGGQLAMQIPDTRAQPSHQRMREAAERVGLGEAVAGVRQPSCEHDPGFYLDVLEPLCGASVDAWTTEYVQQLDGGVADFTRSTGLMAFLDAIPAEADKQRFEQEYRALMAESYPVREATGKTLFPFKRFFVVCSRS